MGQAAGGGDGGIRSPTDGEAIGRREGRAGRGRGAGQAAGIRGNLIVVSWEVRVSVAFWLSELLPALTSSSTSFTLCIGNAVSAGTQGLVCRNVAAGWTTATS